MIATSTVVMFGLMYLNTYAIDHVFFSETRLYMAGYMGGGHGHRNAQFYAGHVSPAAAASKLWISERPAATILRATCQTINAMAAPARPGMTSACTITISRSMRWM
jgi:hypothetical protein